MTGGRLWSFCVLLVCSWGVYSQDDTLYNTECPLESDALNHLVGISEEVTQTCWGDNDDERRRCYYTYVPLCATGTRPLVIDLHDQASCPYEHADRSGWLELANEHCFVVVWPVVSEKKNQTATHCV